MAVKGVAQADIHMVTGKNGKKGADDLLGEDRKEALRELVALGQERGLLSLEQVLDHVPGELDAEDLSSVLQELEAQGIEVEGGEQQAENRPPARSALRVAPEQPEVHAAGDEIDQGQDLVRTYLRQMSRVPLLTREGEVAIAKRIERGEKRVAMALSRSSIIARYVVGLAEELRAGERMLQGTVVLPDSELTERQLANRAKRFPCPRRFSRSSDQGTVAARVSRRSGSQALRAEVQANDRACASGPSRCFEGYPHDQVRTRRSVEV